MLKRVMLIVTGALLMSVLAAIYAQAAAPPAADRSVATSDSDAAPSLHILTVGVLLFIVAYILTLGLPHVMETTMCSASR